MELDEYINQDALALAEQVKIGAVTPRDLVEIAFTAMDTVNDKLNAVVLEMRDEALKQAESGELGDGPFKGVPFVFKDMSIEVENVQVKMGSRTFMNVPASAVDSPLMRQYRQAGLIPIGKTNVPEFGVNATTESVLYGPCKNPWDPELKRTTGGSSGGSASAVSARIVPLAHGSDGGGSIRIPASCCGVFGFMPGLKLSIGTPLFNGSVTSHVLTRSVRDSAAMLDFVLTGKLGTFLECTRSSPSKLRIGVSHAVPTGTAVDLQCRAALEQTAELCRHLGHEVVEVNPDFGDGQTLLRQLANLMEAQMDFILTTLEKKQLSPSPDTVEIANLELGAAGRYKLAEQYLEAQSLVAKAANVYGQLFYDEYGYDVILTPTLAQPPICLGVLDANRVWSPVSSFLEELYRFSPYTGLINILGAPAMSVPLQWSSERLPIGMHFIGRVAGGEFTLFQLAGQLEHAKPWGWELPPYSPRPTLSSFTPLSVRPGRKVGRNTNQA